QGHVDGVGQIDERREDGEWEMVVFRCPRELAVQMVAKGSIAVDGISLTLVDVEEERLRVRLSPHTRQHTTLGVKGVAAAGDRGRGLLPKYVGKYLEPLRMVTRGPSL